MNTNSKSPSSSLEFDDTETIPDNIQGHVYYNTQDEAASDSILHPPTSLRYMEQNEDSSNDPYLNMELDTYIGPNTPRSSVVISAYEIIDDYADNTPQNLRASSSSLLYQDPESTNFQTMAETRMHPSNEDIMIAVDTDNTYEEIEDI